MGNKEILLYAIIAVVSLIALVIVVKVIYAILKLRIVVPTNMVHIAQTKKKSIPFGRGKAAGNVYYLWPSWFPIIGITVIEFPESNFDVFLEGYEAYDRTRVPFVVDIVAFFRIDNAEVAAQRIASFPELKQQLTAVLQGAVRRILATNPLEDVMQERSILGEQFTTEVQNQITEWGVIPVKTIEFMDIRDSAKNDSVVIANIMEKEKSRIEMESRMIASIKEILTSQTVLIQKENAEQLVGQRKAEKEQEIGISNEHASQKILEQKKITTENELKVLWVKDVQNAEIIKEVAIVAAKQRREQQEIQAEAEKNIAITVALGNKESVITTAQGNLEKAKLNAEGIQAEGIAKGVAEEAVLMAPVNSQISLAEEIGANDNYQAYLVKIAEVEAGKIVGCEMAQALKNAEIKVISTAGNPQEGIVKVGDLFTSQGGVNLTSMLTGLTQSEAGQNLVDKFIGNKKTTNPSNATQTTENQ